MWFHTHVDFARLRIVPCVEEAQMGEWLPARHGRIRRVRQAARLTFMINLSLAINYCQILGSQPLGAAVGGVRYRAE